MVHSLTSPAAIAVAATATTAAVSANNKKTEKNNTLQFQREWAASNHHQSLQLNLSVPCRRSVTLGLAGALLGLSLVTGEGGSAIAAARRPPPPPPPTEKKDPNISGTLAKVLASKKRKEAMKDVMAKLREKGKPVN